MAKQYDGAKGEVVVEIDNGQATLTAVNEEGILDQLTVRGTPTRPAVRQIAEQVKADGIKISLDVEQQLYMLEHRVKIG